MKPIRLREEAARELLRETQFYELKRAGTGKRFREAVAAALSLMARFPGSGAPGPSDTRRIKVMGFPFTVFYRDTPSQLVVFAIAPDRRQPGYWVDRSDDGV